jgi:hypothetical protein
MGKSNSKLHPLDQELRAKVVIKSWKKEDLENQIQDNPEVIYSQIFSGMAQIILFYIIPSTSSQLLEGIV